MSDESRAFRPVLIYAAVLATAILLGAALAAGLDYDSLALMLVIFGLLATPLVLRYHQHVLFLCWNSTIGLYFLPGNLPLWIPMSVVTLLLLGLERSFFRERHFLSVPPLTTSLVLFAAVVVVTMLLRGGLGIGWLGSGQLSGGRKYIWILGAIVGYFALSIKAIPPERAPQWCTFYFLGGLTGFIGPLSVWVGGPLERLQLAFHPMEGVAASDGMFRIKAMSSVGMALVGWVLARHGFGGTFHTVQIWRPMVLVLGLVLGGMSGFRTYVVLMIGTVVTMFFLEGWIRTKWVVGWVLSLLCMGVALVVVTPHLPTPVQRGLAFLPLPIDPLVRMEADSTIEWREGLWNEFAGDVPRYFWLGKGMAINSLDMEWAMTIQRFGGKNWYYSYLTGEHHNGVLSVLIGFGVWGLLAWGAVLAAGVWLLVRNYRYGLPALKNVNTFLLANYVVWVVLFVTYAGTLYWQARDFVGILGLSVALNGGAAAPPEPEEATGGEVERA